MDNKFLKTFDLGCDQKALEWYLRETNSDVL